MSDFINLRDLAAGRYRITYDEARDARSRDPWLLQLPCRFGLIYPFGGNTLALEIDCHGKVAARVAALPGVKIQQDGSHETTLLFDVTLFDQVAEIVQPRKLRRVTLTPQRIAQLANARNRRETLTQKAYSVHQNATSP